MKLCLREELGSDRLPPNFRHDDASYCNGRRFSSPALIAIRNIPDRRWQISSRRASRFEGWRSLNRQFQRRLLEHRIRWFFICPQCGQAQHQRDGHHELSIDRCFDYGVHPICLLYAAASFNCLRSSALSTLRAKIQPWP